DNGPLVLSTSMDFYGYQGITISGNDATSIFEVTSGSSLVQSLTITHGLGTFNGAGAANLSGGSATFSNCSITHNKGANGLVTGAGSAGAFKVTGGTLGIAHSLVAYNTGGKGATSSRGGAGALEIISGQANINNSTLAYNMGGSGGAGSSSFGSGNGGEGGTGGVRNENILTSEFNTIAYNTGGSGGARGKTGGTTGASGDGGVNNQGPFFIAGHNIIAENLTGGGNPAPSDVKGGATSQGYNIIGFSSGFTNFTAPGDLLNIDPLFDPEGLADNDGPTLTIALQNGSPGIDSGDPNFNPNVHLFDQRSKPRKSGVRVDRGAVEEQKTKISISDASLQEGDSGTKSLIFAVSVSPPNEDIVSVSYVTTNGSAVAGSDYNAINGRIDIPAGQLSFTIAVPIRGDIAVESNETFFINLSHPARSEIVDRQAVGTIINDDAGPSLSINDATVTEGNSGTTNATFTVTLSAASAQTVTVNAIPTNGTARAPGDYASGGTTLSFSPGQLTKTVTVPVQGDLLDEINEVFYVLLSTSNNATIGRGRGVGTIQDNDVPPTVSIDNLNIGEGNPAQGAPGQRVASFRLNLSAPSGQVVRVSYATAPGGALPATAGNDYVAVAPTQVAFNVGSNVAYARVLLNGDVLNEKDETFLVNLSAPVNATLGDAQAIGTILNDDSAPSLAINNVSIAEGPAQGAPAGTKNLIFTVTLSKASGQTVTVNYATADGIARSTSDYAARSGSLSFAPGAALTRTISVPINGDVLAEDNETFFVLLSGAVNASVGTARGTGTINNDDVSG
ncbi:MAG TPA: Calx-beta domain-containing protein, partial [Abditibacteriaceae bacterium]